MLFIPYGMLSFNKSFICGKFMNIQSWWLHDSWAYFMMVSYPLSRRIIGRSAYNAQNPNDRYWKAWSTGK